MPCSRRDGSVLCHGELHAGLVVQHQPRSPGSVSKHRHRQTCSRDRLCSVCGLPAPGSKQQGRGERTDAPDLLGGRAGSLSAPPPTPGLAAASRPPHLSVGSSGCSTGAAFGPGAGAGAAHLSSLAPWPGWTGQHSGSSPQRRGSRPGPAADLGNAALGPLYCASLSTRAARRTEAA